MPDPEIKTKLTASAVVRAISQYGSFSQKGIYRMVGSLMKERKILDVAPEHIEIEDGKEYIVLKDVEVENHQAIKLLGSGSSYFGLNVIFYRCTFGSFSLRNFSTHNWYFFESEVKGNIWLLNKSRIGNVIFQGSSGVDIIIEDESKCGNIQFWNKTNFGDIRLKGKSVCDSIRADSECTMKNIWLEEDSKSGDIYIFRNSTCGSIFILKESICLGIGIMDGSVADHIVLSSDGQMESLFCDDSQIGRVLLNHSKTGDIHFHRSQCGDITSLNGSHIGDVVVKYESQVGIIHVNNGSATSLQVAENYCSITLHNAQIPLMRISNSTLGVLNWEAGTKGELYIKNCQINSVNFSNTALLKDAVVSISDTVIFLFVMEELLVLGQLLLRKISHARHLFEWRNIEEYVGPPERLPVPILERKRTILRIQSEEFLRSSGKLIENYGGLPLFRIVHSSLGKTEITGCDLEYFRFQYYNSKLLECFITGTKLPKEHIEIYIADRVNQLPDKDYFSQKTSVYNQLKKIFENQGDGVEASWYHSKAMDNQERLLKIAYEERYNPRWYDLRKWFTEEKFNLLNFRLNKLSNNHGESWGKALWFIFLGSLIIFSIYYTALHYTEPFSFQATDRFFTAYFGFLDPTHKMDFYVKKEELWSVPVFFDLFGRIIIGYGIYQLIAAFRRHGRKTA